MADTEHIKKNENTKTAVVEVLLLWLGLALVLGGGGIFVREPGAPPLPILAGVLTPLILFLIALWTIAPFRDFIISLDLQLAAGIQAWRFGGLGFLALYAYNVLPGLFAWPAGLGDMAIGATAPFVLLALRNRPDFVSGKTFMIWNILGITDLVVAVSLGAASAFFGIGINGEITTFPMAEFPLVLIPVFLVPLFIMLHITSLLQARRMGAASKACGWTGSPSQCGPEATISGTP